MKIVKFGAIALALGLFAASCNNEETVSETTTTDTAITTAPAPVETITTTDTAVLVNTASGDTTTKMETTTEVKH